MPSGRPAAASMEMVAGQCLVAQQQFAAALGHDIQVAVTYKLFKMWDQFFRRGEILTLRSLPELAETRVVYKHIGRAGRVGPVNQIIAPPIQQ